MARNGTSVYPATLDSFTRVGTGNYEDESGYEHVHVHNEAMDALEHLQAVCGTTLGTNVFKNAVAGQFVSFTAGTETLTNKTIGTAQITGGTITAVAAIGGTITTLNAGTVANTTLGTSAILGGTITNPQISGGGTITQPGHVNSLLISHSGTAGNGIQMSLTGAGALIYGTSSGNPDQVVSFNSGGTPSQAVLYIGNATGNNADSILDDSGAKLTASGAWTNAPSYKKYKDPAGKLSGVAEKISEMQLDIWNYKDKKIDGKNRSIADKNTHCSPYHDEFFEKFGIGKINEVNHMDYIGVLFVAIKELLDRIKVLESK